MSEDFSADPEFGNCVLNSSWFYSFGAAVVSVPLCRFYKSYKPLIGGIGVGTTFDIINGYQVCTRKYRAKLGESLAHLDKTDAKSKK